MTAALAIAATSEILRFIVTDALQQAGQALNFAPPPVTIGPPPRGLPAGGEAEAAAVNLFMHQALPNDSWRNAPGFVRGPLGNRLSQPALALDLSYLLSTHGTGIDCEISLATVLQALQQTPVPTSALVGEALAALADQEAPQRRLLASEGLAARFESLTIKPQTLGIDSTARLWAAAQAPLRPSVSYLVTVMFGQEATPVRPAPPVLSDGG